LEKGNTLTDKNDAIPVIFSFIGRDYGVLVVIKD
jgi:hypothetical protein